MTQAYSAQGTTSTGGIILVGTDILSKTVPRIYRIPKSLLSVALEMTGSRAY